MPFKTATFIKRLDAKGEGRVFHLSPPLKPFRLDEEPDHTGYEYVWVSAVITTTGPETYIFGCDKDGEVLSWGELPGSQRGILDINFVLAQAGYKVLRYAEERDWRTS